MEIREYLQNKVVYIEF